MTEKFFAICHLCLLFAYWWNKLDHFISQFWRLNLSLISLRSNFSQVLGSLPLPTITWWTCRRKSLWRTASTFPRELLHFRRKTLLCRNLIDAGKGCLGLRLEKWELCSWTTWICQLRRWERKVVSMFHDFWLISSFYRLVFVLLRNAQIYRFQI